RGLDLALRTCETSGHRGLGHEKRACDLLGRQAAEQSERERYLRLGGERGVAAGEDETETVVLHGSRFLGDVGGVAFRCEHGHLAEEFLSASLAAQAVDGSIASSGRDPAAWVWWQAVACPCAQGDGERLLYCLLGEVDVAEGADQGGDRSAGLLAEDPADLGLVEPGCGVDV